MKPRIYSEFGSKVCCHDVGGGFPPCRVDHGCRWSLGYFRSLIPRVDAAMLAAGFALVTGRITAGGEAADVIATSFQDLAPEFWRWTSRS